MSKRLIVLLALAFVVGVSFAAYAEVQNVKVSGDITGYTISQSQFGLMGKASLKNRNSFASIARVKVDADLTDNVMTTVRLLNERYWGSGDENSMNTDIDLDLAYITLKEFLYSPLTLMVGRQELHYGNQMVIGDPDTNGSVTAASVFNAANTVGGNAALSARKAFDAIRAVLNYDPLVVDLVMAKVNETLLKNSDDVDLYGINAAYKIDQNTSLEGYWFIKKTNKKAFALPVNKADTVHTLGARIGNTNVKDNVDLTSSLEGALQFGRYNDGSRVSTRNAYALEGAITAGLKKVKYTPSVTLLAAYFSGKKNPNSSSNPNGCMKGWNQMFENQSFGDITNQMLPQTNARIIGGMATMKPADDVMLKGEYYAYWWDKKFNDGDAVTTLSGDTVTMRSNKFVGSELDLTATYNYTEDVQFNLLGGIFIPGPAFSKSNDSNATELVGSMKVTF